MRITARLSNGALLVEVGDDGSGLRATPERVIQDGHGLGNVRRRLDTMYGAAGSIEVLPAASGRGTVARLRVPVGGSAGAGGP